MRSHILNLNKRLKKNPYNRVVQEDLNIKETYKENFQLMVENIFRDNKGENDTKEMYSNITALTDIKQLTEFITPGESFIISNDQAKQIQTGEL